MLVLTNRQQSAQKNTHWDLPHALASTDTHSLAPLAHSLSSRDE